MIFDRITNEEYLKEAETALKKPVNLLPENPPQVGYKYSHLSVLGLKADESACGYYRVGLPMTYLAMQGAKTESRATCSVIDSLNFKRIIAPRQHSPEIYEMLQAALWNGAYVHYELDDDLDHVSTTSPAYKVYHTGSTPLKNINQTMSSLASMVVSTAPLARWYKKNMQLIGVIDNYIDFSLREWAADVEWIGGQPKFTPKRINRPARWENKLVIGYSCGNTHTEDWMEWGKSIIAALKATPEAILVLYSAPSTQYEFMRIVESLGIPESQIEFQGPKHIYDHPSGLEGLDIQIGPLACNQFNLCKTALKAYESMASYSVFMGSNVGPYADLNARTNKEVIKLIGKNSHFLTWTEAFKWAAQNRGELERLKTAGLRWVIENQSMELNYTRWPLTWAALEEKIEKGEFKKPASKNHNLDQYKTYKKYGLNDPDPIYPGVKYKKGSYPAYG